MPLSMTPGSSIIVVVQFSDVDIGLRRDLSGSALPKFPQSASRGARISGLPGLRYVAACQVARPPVTDRTGSPQHQRAFTSRPSADRSPSLPLDITTAWTGLLVLAGLSAAGIAASLAAPDPYEPNSGSHLGWVTARRDSLTKFRMRFSACDTVPPYCARPVLC